MDYPGDVNGLCVGELSHFPIPCRLQGSVFLHIWGIPEMSFLCLSISYMESLHFHIAFPYFHIVTSPGFTYPLTPLYMVETTMEYVFLLMKVSRVGLVMLCRRVITIQPLHWEYDVDVNSYFQYSLSRAEYLECTRVPALFFTQFALVLMSVACATLLLVSEIIVQVSLCVEWKSLFQLFAVVKQTYFNCKWSSLVVKRGDRETGDFCRKLPAGKSSYFLDDCDAPCG